MKKFKPDPRESQRNHYAKGTDLYTMFAANGVTNANNELANNLNNAKTIQPFVKQEIKQEPICQMESDSVPVSQSPKPHGVKRPGDPYEFEEDGGGSACNMDGFKRGPGGVKEEPKDVKKGTTGNLFTSEGLQPSMKDLDQIFDNSDDTSGDEAVSPTLIFTSFSIL